MSDVNKSDEMKEPNQDEFISDLPSFKKGWDAAQAGDYEVSLKIWMPLAEHGNYVAQYNVGVSYEKGRDAAVDQYRADVCGRSAACDIL